MKGQGAAVVAALLTMSAWAGTSDVNPRAWDAPYYVAPTLAELVPGEVPAGATKDASLVAARGEREAFFLVLRGEAAANHRPRVKWSPLRAPGHRIASAQVRVFRALWVDAGARRVPDALVPVDSRLEVVGAGVEAGEDVPLYVEIAVPRGAAPGVYRGQLEVETTSGSLKVPIDLHVLEAQLPARASLPTAFDFSSREAALGAGATLDQKGLRRLAKDYATVALANRVTLIGGTGVAPSFRTTPGENTLRLDFTAYDAEMAALMNGVGALDGAAQSAITLRLPNGIRGIERFKYVMAFAKHLEEKGWADRLIAFSDHPALGGVVVPDGILKHQVRECAFSLCASGKANGRRWWTLRPRGEAGALKLGTSNAAVRAIGWLAFAGGAQGLRFGDTVAGFGEAMWNGTTPANALFYPVRAHHGAAARATVVESLRLKLLRDGLEDYELLKLARDSGRAGLTGEWLTKIAAAPGRIAADPALWRSARQALADAAQTPALPEQPVMAKTARAAEEKEAAAVPADRACAGKSDGSTNECP